MGYQIGGGGSQQPATQAPTQPTTKKPTPTSPPCEDDKSFECSTKCNTEKKCTKNKNCPKKCKATCSICDDGSGECPGGKYNYCEVLDKSMLSMRPRGPDHSQ